jgi:hypothetical protein
VVPERDRVHTGSEEPVCEPGRDPDPVGRVLAVRDTYVDLEVRTQRGEQSLDRGPARTSDDVGDEEDAQGA